MPSFRLTIARRLGLAFATMLTVLAVCAAISYWSMSRLNREVENVGTRTIPHLLAATELLRTVEHSVSHVDNIPQLTDAAAIARETETIKRDAVQISGYIEQLQKSADDSASKAALADVESSVQTYNAAVRDVLDGLSKGQAADVGGLVKDKVYPAESAVTTATGHLIDVLTDLVDANRQLAGADYRQGRTILLVLSGLGFLFAGIAARWVSRTVKQRIDDAVVVADAVAHGDLSREIDLSNQDEVGKLMASLKIMQQNLERFVAAERQLAKEHAEGFISKTIPAHEYQGVFADAAREVNELIASHVAVKMRLAEVAGRYAVGDFTVQMDRLPNEKAVLTETMDKAQANLQAMTVEIQTLVDAAQRGELSTRGNADRFEHGFHDMVDGINQTLDAIVAPINEVSRVLEAMAAGDLTQVVEGDFQGDFGKLKDNANQTVTSLKDLAGQISSASDSISTASREIAAGNSELSTRTEQQAASLEETAASVEELTSTVKQNADNARQASQLAVGARDVAVKGGDVVREVVQTMDAISQASGKISEIIGVIDGIAFQTNILALNAAVEAARAGDQGRGFAVVATEVRNLAQRSAAAAKEIKTLIGNSVDQVAAGTNLVAKAGVTMEEIVTSVKRVTDIMGDISVASQEQSAGIGQLGQAITQMDEGTQQNAAMVEQVAAAAQSLQGQAEGLVASAQRFKLDQNDGRSTGDCEANAEPAATSLSVRRNPAAARSRREATPAHFSATRKSRSVPVTDKTGTWTQF